MSKVLGGARITIDVGTDEKPNSVADCDITLGLDFLTKGGFAITHGGGQLVLSFCYPWPDAPIFYDKWSKVLRPGSDVDSVIIDESRDLESRGGR